MVGKRLMNEWEPKFAGGYDPGDNKMGKPRGAGLARRSTKKMSGDDAGELTPADVDDLTAGITEMPPDKSESTVEKPTDGITSPVGHDWPSKPKNSVDDTSDEDSTAGGVSAEAWTPEAIGKLIDDDIGPYGFEDEYDDDLAYGDPDLDDEYDEKYYDWREQERLHGPGPYGQPGDLRECPDCGYIGVDDECPECGAQLINRDEIDMIPAVDRMYEFISKAKEVIEEGGPIGDMDATLCSHWAASGIDDVCDMPDEVIESIHKLTDRFPKFRSMLSEAAIGDKKLEKMSGDDAEMSEIGDPFNHKIRNDASTPILSGTPYGDSTRTVKENIAKLTRHVMPPLREAFGRIDNAKYSVCVDGKCVAQRNDLANAVLDLEELLQVFDSDDVVLEASVGDKTRRIGMIDVDKRSPLSDGSRAVYRFVETAEAAAANIIESGAMCKVLRHSFGAAVEPIAEKWAGNVEIDKTGEYADKSVAELKKMRANLRGKKGNKSKMSEINFAIRAKTGWKKGEGATK